jgi:hypothetical protein
VELERVVRVRQGSKVVEKAGKEKRRQGRAGQDRTGQGRAGQGRAGQGRAEGRRSGGQDMTGQHKVEKSMEYNLHELINNIQLTWRNRIHPSGSCRKRYLHCLSRGLEKL